MEKLVPVFQKLGKVARSWKPEEEKVSEKGWSWWSRRYWGERGKHQGSPLVSNSGNAGPFLELGRQQRMVYSLSGPRRAEDDHLPSPSPIHLRVLATQGTTDEDNQRHGMTVLPVHRRQRQLLDLCTGDTDNFWASYFLSFLCPLLCLPKTCMLKFLTLSNSECEGISRWIV